MTKDEIINLIELNINIEGFIKAPVEQGVYLIKKDTERELSLYLGFNGSLDRYFLQTPFATIRFLEIEDKINHTSKELGIVAALGNSQNGKLALWQIFARVL